MSGIVHGCYKPDPDKVVDIPVNELLLDGQNPRLFGRNGAASQEEILRVM